MDDEFTIRPVDLDPVEPVVPRQVAPAPAASTAPRQTNDQLSDAVERNELAAHAPSEPADVGGRATVHDAAAHGNPIAQAIERAAAGPAAVKAEPPAGTVASDIDPNAQMLGGAAASAGSGQAALLHRDTAAQVPDDLQAPGSSDGLAKVTRRTDEEGRRQRRREQAAQQSGLVPIDEPPRDGVDEPGGG